MEEPVCKTGIHTMFQNNPLRVLPYLMADKIMATNSLLQYICKYESCTPVLNGAGIPVIVQPEIRNASVIRKKVWRSGLLLHILFYIDLLP
jgi:hypothetical protein